MDPVIRVSPLAAALVVGLPLVVFGAARLFATPDVKLTELSMVASASPHPVPELVFLQPPTEGETASSGRHPVVAPGPGDDVPRELALAAPVEPSGDPTVTAPQAAPSATPTPSSSSGRRETADAPPAAPAPPDPPRVSCGLTTCAPGGVCCSATCGICAAPGQPCTQQGCGLASYPTSVACGANTCDVGQICCNASCGICTSPGAGCSQTVCDDGPTFPVSQACGLDTCVVGTVC